MKTPAMGLKIFIALLAVAAFTTPAQTSNVLPPGYEPPRYVDLSTNQDLETPGLSDGSTSSDGEEISGSADSTAGAGNDSTNNKKNTKTQKRSPYNRSSSTSSSGFGGHTSISDNFSEDQSLFPPICGCSGCRVSSNFGPRTDPVYGGSANHFGCDIAAPGGTLVYAPADGEVLDMVNMFPSPFKENRKVRQTGYGNQIILRHKTPSGTTYLTRFGHLETVLVQKGQKVRKGDPIGKVDSTGKSTGNHLHYEVMKCRGDGGEKDDSCEKKNPSHFFDTKQVAEDCGTVRRDTGAGDGSGTSTSQ